MKTIKIAAEFSSTPLGRFPADSEFSGERFREELLVPALKAHDQVEVDLDDAEGFGSSFLEEAFGGLVREGHFDKQTLKQRLKITTTNPDFQFYVERIWKYIKSARHRTNV